MSFNFNDNVIQIISNLRQTEELVLEPIEFLFFFNLKFSVGYTYYAFYTFIFGCKLQVIEELIILF